MMNSAMPRFSVLVACGWGKTKAGRCARNAEIDKSRTRNRSGPAHLVGALAQLLVVGGLRDQVQDGNGQRRVGQRVRLGVRLRGAQRGAAERRVRVAARGRQRRHRKMQNRQRAAHPSPAPGNRDEHEPLFQSCSAAKASLHTHTYAVCSVLRPSNFTDFFSGLTQPVSHVLSGLLIRTGFGHWQEAFSGSTWMCLPVCYALQPLPDFSHHPTLLLIDEAKVGERLL